MENNNNLQNLDNTNLSAMMDMFTTANTGFEDIDATDLAIAKIKLLQSTSDEVSDRSKGVFPGQFYNSQTGEAVDFIECYLLKVSKSRAMFSYPYVKGSKAKCSSVDCQKGTTDGNSVRSCDGCEHADWNAAKANGKNKPDCNMSYVFFGAYCDDRAPFRFTCSGDAVKIGKAFINTLMYKKMPMFVHKVKIGAKQITNQKGTYYTPTFELVEAYDPIKAKSLPQEKQNELCAEWAERSNQATGLAEFYSKAVENEIRDADVVDVQDMQDVSDSAEGRLF